MCIDDSDALGMHLAHSSESFLTEYIYAYKVNVGQFLRAMILAQFLIGQNRK